MRFERYSYYEENAVLLAQTRLRLACQGAELGQGFIELKQHFCITHCRDFLSRNALSHTVFEKLRF